MKEKIKKIIKILKKYLPDILFLVGVWITSYSSLKPPVYVGGISIPDMVGYTEHATWYQVLGIMLIALALDIAIRRYSAKRNSE